MLIDNQKTIRFGFKMLRKSTICLKNFFFNFIDGIFLALVIFVLPLESKKATKMHKNS